MNLDWHSKTGQEVIKFLESDLKKGLKESEAKLRQEKFGENKLPEEKALSPLRVFLWQFKSPLIYILIIAGIITLFLREFTDAIVIFGAVFLNAIVGFFQENKASKTLKELKKIIRYKAIVLREGNFKVIDSKDVVVGDIIVLKPGAKIPADGRIIEAQNLRVNEMILTGEWLPARKNSEVLPKETPLADRDNMVYMGTVVESGTGKVIVTAIGNQTEIGRIARMIQETKEEKTPYQKKLAHLSKIIGIIITLICFLIFVVGIIAGKEFIEMFTTSVAVAVAAIPEGLPVAITVIFALGMQRILKKKGLVRRLVSAETLGSTSIICTDKTGTLTKGKMRVVEVVTPSVILKERPDKRTKILSIKTATLTSEAFIENPKDSKRKWILRGRPTDKALLEAGIKAGIDSFEGLKRKKIAQLPFNPINKFAAALYQNNKRNKILYVSGAPEKILAVSEFFEIKGKKIKLNKQERELLQSRLNKLAKKGLRIVGTAYKKIPDPRPRKQNWVEEIDQLVFTGFIALKDPIRKEVKKAIKICQAAGMRPIIVTGDHKLTAKAVAEELGIKVLAENILEGKELEKMSDEEFREKLKDVKVYARVEPKHKMKIIGAWQERGEAVAMTGDGINDAPALKKADIGIALGSGTDVAKEASDLVLLNDSFSIIVAAVEEGRLILDNIRKTITYLLSSSFTEIILIGVSILAGLPLPVTAVQILWINLIEDTLPNIALAFEPKEKDLMKHKPPRYHASLLTREMKAIIFIIGLLTDLVLLGVFFWLIHKNYDLWYLRTIVFAMLGFDSIFYVFSCRNLRKNIWQINPFSNKFLTGAWIIGLVTLVAAIYLPAFNTLLGTVPLRLSAWWIILGLGAINLILIELTKHYFIVRHQTEI
jgi:Ca2+-transporting ATPase